MRSHTVRIQSLVTKEQFKVLKTLSRKLNKPISVLVRESIEKSYFDRLSLERRRAAVKQLADLREPVSNWPEMEKEIIRGSLRE